MNEVKQVFTILRNGCSILLFIMIVASIVLFFLVRQSGGTDVMPSDLYSSQEEYTMAQNIEKLSKGVFWGQYIKEEVSAKYIFDNIKYVCVTSPYGKAVDEMIEELDKLNISYDKTHIEYLWKKLLHSDSEETQLFYLIRKDGTTLPIISFFNNDIEIKMQIKEKNWSDFCSESLDGKVIFNFQLIERP